MFVISLFVSMVFGDFSRDIVLNLCDFVKFLALLRWAFWGLCFFGLLILLWFLQQKTSLEGTVVCLVPFLVQPRFCRLHSRIV